MTGLRPRQGVQEQRYSRELTIIIGKGLKVGKNALLSRT